MLFINTCVQDIDIGKNRWVNMVGDKGVGDKGVGDKGVGVVGAATVALCKCIIFPLTNLCGYNIMFIRPIGCHKFVFS